MRQGYASALKQLESKCNLINPKSGGNAHLLGQHTLLKQISDRSVAISIVLEHLERKRTDIKCYSKYFPQRPGNQHMAIYCTELTLIVRLGAI